MTKRAVASPALPTPTGPYSQGIVANGFLFTAGFTPHDPTTGVAPEGVGEQTRQVLRNLQTLLKEVGATFDDVVKVNAHLQNLYQDVAEYNAAYTEFFSQPYPVRTTVGSDLNNILVEIEVVVALPTQD